MDFALSEEQERLRDAARELLARECMPARVRAVMEAPAGHDPALWSLLAAQGWLGVLVPERHGGAGLGLLDAALLCWELGRVVAPGPFRVSAVGAVVALLEAGTRAQQERWLPALASGEAIATLAVAEPPEGGFDLRSLSTRARRRASGWCLDGAKLFVEHAHVADVLLVAARRGGSASAPALFAVPATARGVRVVPLVSVDETARPCEVRLREVQAPSEAALLRSPGGRPAARDARGPSRALDACAIAVAAESLGSAERALELAVEYVKVREQFGRAVGSFQAVQHLAAEAASRLEPARALIWYAAWAFDARPREAALAAAMAKAHASDVSRWIVRTAVEMHGGIAFTWEHDMHLYFKRALANASAFGDADAHRERVAELSGF